MRILANMQIINPHRSLLLVGLDLQLAVSSDVALERGRVDVWRQMVGTCEHQCLMMRVLLDVLAVDPHFIALVLHVNLGGEELTTVQLDLELVWGVVNGYEVGVAEGPVPLRGGRMLNARGLLQYLSHSAGCSAAVVKRKDI